MRVITQKDLDAFALAATELQDVCRRGAEAARAADALMQRTALAGDVGQALYNSLASKYAISTIYTESFARFEALAFTSLGLKRPFFESRDSFFERVATAIQSTAQIRATWASNGILFEP